MMDRPAMGRRQRRGATLLQMLVVIGLTSVVLSGTVVTLVSVMRLSRKLQARDDFRRVEHLRLPELRSAIHLAQHVELEGTRVTLYSTQWKEPRVLDDSSLKWFIGSDRAASATWEIDAGMLQVVDPDKNTLFEAAIGALYQSRGGHGRPRAAMPKRLQPPLEALPPDAVKVPAVSAAPAKEAKEAGESRRPPLEEPIARTDK